MTETTPGTDPDRVNTENLKDYRALRRSRTDRKVAGVAGGLGRHLNIDPTILRVVFVVLVFFGGAGLLAYGAAWLLVPEEDTGESVISTSESTRNALLIGAAVLAGLMALTDSWHGYGIPWLVIVGLILVVVLSTKEKGRPSQQYPAPAYGPAPPPPPAGTETTEDTMTQTLPPYATETGTTYPGATYAGPPTTPGWYPPPTPPAPVPPRRNGPLLFGFTLALIALGLGALGLYDVSGGDVADAAYPALALALTGLMLVVGSFFGRAGGLILVGLVAALATLGAGLGEPGFRGDRDQVYRPATVAEVEDGYRVPAGRIELDLTDVDDLEGLDGRSIELSANVGEIVVIVPDDLDVLVEADIDLGGLVETPENTRDGWDVSLTDELTVDDPRAAIELDLELHAGHIEVRQR